VLGGPYVPGKNGPAGRVRMPHEVGCCRRPGGGARARGGGVFNLTQL
jgi:hypothetical protein